MTAALLVIRNAVRGGEVLVDVRAASPQTLDSEHRGLPMATYLLRGAVSRQEPDRYSAATLPVLCRYYDRPSSLATIVDGWQDEAMDHAGERPMARGFAATVRAHRQRLGLTQEELAELTGLSTRSVGKLETGRTATPRPATVRLLADAFGLTGADRDHFCQVASTTSDQLNEAGAPAQLPPDVLAFTGRDAQLAQLDALLAQTADHQTAVVISAVSGTAGVGKTTLAVHWAQRISGQFPDGQLYLNLRGFDPTCPPMDAADAIRHFLAALQVPPQRIPASLDAQTGLYRSLLTGRRMLVLLDNARDTAQVRPLLPGAAGCLVVVTSRNWLSGLLTAAAAVPVNLEPFTNTEARQLLERRLGAQRTLAEPDVVDEIIARCARLPLALAIVAARAAARPKLPLHVLATELGEARSSLDALSEPDPAVDLRTALDVSYRTLSEGAATLFRRLGLHPGPEFSAPAAANLAGVAVPQIRPLLTELARSHLLGEHTPGRYRFHDLIGAHAAELAHRHDGEGARHAATHGMLDFYLHTARSAARLINPHRARIAPDPPPATAEPEALEDRAQALGWLIREQPVLRAVAAHAASTGFDTHAWQLTWTMGDFLQRHGCRLSWQDTQRMAIGAARRLADPLAQALLHRNLAGTLLHQGSHDDAHAHLRQALDHFGTLGDLAGQARTRLDIGVSLDRQGRHHEALAQTRHALALYRTAGDRAGQAYALNGIGWLHSQLGNHQQALDSCQQALAVQQQIGDQTGEAGTWDSIGFAHHCLGRHGQAAKCYLQALDLLRDSGDRNGEATVLTHLGETYHAADKPDAARDAWQQALTVLREIGHPDTDEIQLHLSRLAARSSAGDQALRRQ